MIVVLADDISGAAELAGIGWRRGLSSEVHLEFDPDTDAEMVAVDTDSRSLPVNRAAEKVRAVCREIVRSRPAWIFKKTDSVFRGHLAAEIGAILDATDLEKALLIPANPSKRRLIEEGRYLIDGVPLDETIFAEDPEFPARTSSVEELLGADADPRIEVPGEVNAANLEALAGTAGGDTLPAGGADFFEALLQRRASELIQEGSIGDSTRLDRPGARLFVCGSLAAWSERRDRFRAAGDPIFQLPSQGGKSAWREGILDELGAGRNVLVAIGDSPAGQKNPAELVSEFGGEVAQVIDAMGADLAGVFLEGGATAVAVLNHRGPRQFRVIGETGPGAPILQSGDEADPLFCPKPGSYPWPADILG